MRAVLLDILATRFGVRGEEWARWVRAVKSLEQLRSLVHPARQRRR